MSPFIVLHDLIEENGKTIKQNNLERQHTIPIGSLVEIRSDGGADDGLRLLVAYQGRDCDGTPLYWLTGAPESVRWDNVVPTEFYARALLQLTGGYSDESLVVIRRVAEGSERP